MKKKKSFGKSSFIFALLYVFITGSVCGWQQPTSLSLETVMKKLAEYCDLIRKSSLDFVCDETVIQEEFYQMKLRHGSNVHPVPLTQAKKSSFLYSYHLIQKTPEIKEDRILLKDGEKKTFKKNAGLYTRFHHQLIVFGPLVFQKSNQSLYDFQFKQRTRLNERDVVVVRVKAKQGSFAPLVEGEFWIDETDFTIHKICIQQESIQGYDLIEQISRSLRLNPHFTLTQEYSILKRGIRFPSRAEFKESYINSDQSRFLNISQIEILYQNYQFFAISTHSTVEEYRGHESP